MATTKHSVNITLNAKNNAQKVLGGVTKALGGLATAAAGLATGAVAGVGALGAGLADLAMDAAPVAKVSATFDALTESIGETSDAMLSELRTATDSMVSDADLMTSANRFMSMGLADSADGAAELAEMATTLGAAMGGDASESMENFALMLANQSIPRLDEFGISSGKVRERVNELMEATEGLTREQAFMQAVSEEGAVAMERLGDAGADSAATSMAQLQATIDNLKDSVGTAFLPVLQELLGTVADLATTYGPMLAGWAEFTAGTLLDGLAPAMELVAELFASPEFRSFAQDVGVALTGLLSQVAGLLINEVLPPLLELAQNLLPTITPLITQVLDALLPLGAELISRLVPVLTQILSAVLPPLLPLFETLANVVLMVADAVLPLATTLLEMLLPPLMELISAILPVITPLLNVLMEAFSQILAALMPLIEVLLAELLPIFTQLIAELLPPLIELFTAVVEVLVRLLAAVVPVIAQLVEELAPIIAALAELISAVLNVALEALTGVIQNVVGPAFEWLKNDVLDPVIGALDGISDAVSGVIDWIGRMAARLSDVSLPGWLTPGSPTPFELGLRGIADAMGDVSGMSGDMLQGVGAAPPQMAGGGGAMNITVNIGNVSEGDAYRAGQQAGRGIVDELRSQGMVL